MELRNAIHSEQKSLPRIERANYQQQKSRIENCKKNPFSVVNQSSATNVKSCKDKFIGSKMPKYGLAHWVFYQFGRHCILNKICLALLDIYNTTVTNAKNVAFLKLGWMNFNSKFDLIFS